MTQSIYTETLVDGQPHGYLKIAGSDYEMKILQEELEARRYANAKATGGLVIPQPDEIMPVMEAK